MVSILIFPQYQYTYTHTHTLPPTLLTAVRSKLTQTLLCALQTQNTNLVRYILARGIRREAQYHYFSRNCVEVRHSRVVTENKSSSYAQTFVSSVPHL